MGRDLGLDGVVDHFTLSGDEAGWLRNKTGATRLGFAVQLKFLTWRGRFPKMRLELPPDAVEHVAKQVGVAASELGFYDFTSRVAKRHRSELRDLTGWHECSKTDLVKLVSHLVDVIWHDERREEQVRAELLRQMRVDLIEPPTAAQIATIIRSALHQADDRAVAEVAARLAREEDCPRRLDALVFTDPTGDSEQDDDTASVDGDGADEDLESVLSDIKSHPGNVSLNSLLDEISKLKQVRAVSIPAKAFTGIGVQVINAWRARASAAAPSHLRRFSPEVRHVLLAALLFQRQRGITDTLVDLLNSTVHRINARAEKKVTEAFVVEFTKVRGKSGLLGKIAAASLGAPDGSVRSVVFPAAGGEKTLKDLVAEMKATNAEFARSKREVFKSSYSNHYRSGLMKLLGVLDFRSSNDQHKPVMDALKLIERHKDSSTTYLPLGETIPLEGVVRKDWMEFALFTPDKGPKRVMRTVYEACVFQALRDRLRCKEIWVVAPTSGAIPTTTSRTTSKSGARSTTTSSTSRERRRCLPPNSRPRCAPSSARWTPNCRNCRGSRSAASTATARSSSPSPSRRKSRRTCASSRRRSARNGAPSPSSTSSKRPPCAPGCSRPSPRSARGRRSTRRSSWNACS
ncbi:DUF4158 domain-containing protein [Streptomyces sp. NPDC046237]|uniref:DUF4158 domain-containing protein n=1 Tax=Streptomyces sp. NPDC046237 TaxID=3154914 RepID=UPI0034016595